MLAKLLLMWICHWGIVLAALSMHDCEGAIECRGDAFLVQENTVLR